MLWRERGDEYSVARALHLLASANAMLDLYEEGIQQAKEALEVFERLGRTTEQVACLIALAQVLWDNGQLDEAEEAITRAINLLNNGPEFSLCQAHRILGNIYRVRGDTEKAIHHYNIAIGIASKFNWTDQLFWIQYNLTVVYCNEHDFDNATTHIQQAKEHALGDEYQLGRAMELQAQIWYKQKRFEDGVSEASCAIKIYEKLGAALDLNDCRDLLQNIERARKGSPTSGG